MQLQELLERSAGRTPERCAIVHGDRRISYGELEARANALAHAMRDAGLRRGDRVLIQLDDAAAAAVAVFAVLKADGVFSVVHPTTKPAQVLHLLRDCEAAALVTDGRRTEAIPDLDADAPALRFVVVSGQSDAGGRGRRVLRLESPDALRGDPPPRAGIDVDLASLVYTSGSTGVPKGVMLTHRAMLAAAASITTYLENVAADVILSCLPLSFDYGLYQLLMACRVGARLVLERSFAYPHATLSRVVEEGVTGLPLVPTMSAILTQMDLGAYDLAKLRYVTNTAAALPVEHVRRLRAALPHVRIFSMYGLTECKRVAYLPPEEIDTRPGSVGKAMPNVEVWIEDEAGGRLGAGQVGELVVRGSNLMSGYWAMPDETAQMLRPGPLPGERVLHTGDLFRADDDGYLYFVGRRDEMLKSRGEKVSPREVENALHEHPDVAHAVVLGIPDRVLGDAIVAFVVPRHDAKLAPAALRAHCARKLEDWKVPKRVEVLSELPVRPSGKVDRRALIDSVLDEKDGQPGRPPVSS
ncbi:fatty-acyl-CoA synthase [Burkholderiales bacterium]|nr:fatty-acyl-CoA synthase [Burkholderiales bacterium]